MNAEPSDRQQRRVARVARVARVGLVGLVTLAVGLVVLVVVAALLVPWHPYPGGRLTPTPAHDVFSDAQIARAEHFSRWARIWSWSALVISLGVACWLGFGRSGRTLVRRLPGPWWVQVPLTVAALTMVTTIVTAPSSVALQQLRRDAGLSGEGWGAYARDDLVGAVVTIIATSVGVLVLLACARRWPRAWPAVVGGLLGSLVFASSFVYPVVVEPLFNHFTPLPDGPLRSQILALADQEGVHVDDVLVSDASRRTTTLNAYVSGFGDTRRVVLYDNTVNSLPPAEVDAVVAHELGHARHDDVLTGTILGAAGALVGVGLLSLLVGALRRRGYPDVSQAAAVPLVLALVALGSFLALPVENGISRQIETRADVDSLRTTRDPAAFTAMQKELALRALADPTPPAWSQWWFGSHPTVLARTALADRIGR